jgi:hypothetical protein
MAHTDTRSSRSVSTPSRRGSVIAVITEEVARGERALSPLGQRLLEARRRIEDAGIPLLDDDALEREKAERQGGISSA